MRRFLQGQAVKFVSTYSKHVFHARVVSLIDDKYHMVEDRSGKPPRPVRTDRLELDIDGAIFEGKDAA
jgi:hypothetical protein